MKFKSKPTNTPQGALAKLWRNVIRDNHIEHNLSYLITRYVTKNVSNSKNLRRKTRSTLEVDITANEMTWKKFAHIVFHYLSAVRMDVTIKRTYAHGHTAMHTVGIKSTDNEAEADNLDITEDLDVQQNREKERT